MRSDPALLLRQHGFRVTAQRLAVLGAVDPGQHVTADAVVDSVRAGGGSISLQAAYDALAVLVSVGLVRRFEPAGSPALFEIRVNDNHHHLICRECGAVADVDCAIGAAPCLTPSSDHGFTVDEAEVTFWGRCPTCQERSA